jgi:GT2 family glycosyltransferase
MAGSLSWALVVSTYNRQEVLPRCLELGVRQSRAPLEVIVVDASPDWAATRARVLTEIAALHPEIRWEYVEARRRSLPAQRNQGIGLARGDILFLIDDDSLMYPDCAEQIMRVYEADPEGRIAGVMADEAAQPPGEAAGAPAGPAPPALPPGKLRQLKDRLLRRLGVIDYLLPYNAHPPSRPWPEAFEKMRLLPRDSLIGAWMTFRRHVVQAEPFDEILDAYAYLEDADASNRAARHGLLVLAQDARLCHLRASGGRLSLETVAALGTLNALVLHRLHSPDQRSSISRYRSFLVKQFLVEGLRDLSAKRWSFPRARGVVVAAGQFRRIFTSDPQALRQWYPAFQKELLRRDPRSR